MKGWMTGSENVSISEDVINFTGRRISFQNSEVNVFAEVFYEGKFTQGSITTEISVEDKEVIPISRFGIIFKHSNINNAVTFNRMDLHNSGCSLVTHINEGFSQKAFSDSVRLDRDQKFQLKLTVEGSRIIYNVNGADILISDLTENIFSGTSIGFYFCSNANISLDLKKTRINQREPTAFVIMKFEKDYENLYQQVICPVCKEKGYEPVKADEIYLSSAILQDIINQIATASLVIADVTLDNPNVFYELGYSHALRKPTIILAEKEKRGNLPFDISGFRTILYENSIGGKAAVEETLRKYIERIQTNKF